MISQIMLKGAVIALLNKEYGLPCYGLEVQEGYETPSFFVQLIPVDVNAVTVNAIENEYLFSINYFQETKSEEDMLNVAWNIQRALGMKLKVDDRSLDVSDYSYDFIGEKSDVLQITFKVSFLDTPGREETQPSMGTVTFQTGLEDI